MTESIRGDGRNNRRKRSHDRIVQAAFLLVERGNWRPSVKDIAAQAGVSVRTVFDIFGTLDDVYEELMRDRSMTLRVFISDVLERGGSDALLRLVLTGRESAPFNSQESV